jgi:hypothetical protein
MKFSVVTDVKIRTAVIVTSGTEEYTASGTGTNVACSSEKFAQNLPDYMVS